MKPNDLARFMRGRGKRGGNPETPLQAAIATGVELAHRPDVVHLFRVQCGAAQGLNGGFMELAPKGTADLCGWARGRFLAVEVKLPGEHLKPEQRDFLRLVVASGGWAFVARDVAVFLAELAAALGGVYRPPVELCA